jgi:hypothetical protein
VQGPLQGHGEAVETLKGFIGHAAHVALLAPARSGLTPLNISINLEL